MLPFPVCLSRFPLQEEGKRETKKGESQAGGWGLPGRGPWREQGATSTTERGGRDEVGLGNQW